MKSENTTRESQRTSELVTKYKNKGYVVSTPNSQIELPDFLRGESYIPDIIAKSEKESLVIEVKSRKTARDLAHLARIAEKVNSQPGWLFVLVFTNPRDKQSEDLNPSIAKVRELISKSRTIGHSTEAHTEAAFLFAWSAIEASLRLIPSQNKSTRGHASMWTLIRDAAMLGYLGREDAHNLERLFKVRSAILHAGDSPSPQVKDLEKLRNIATELLGQINGTET